MFRAVLDEVVPVMVPDDDAQAGKIRPPPRVFRAVDTAATRREDEYATAETIALVEAVLRVCEGRPCSLTALYSYEVRVTKYARGACHVSCRSSSGGQNRAVNGTCAAG